MNIEQASTDSLIEYALNNVTHSEKQVERLASSIKEFGFNVPLLVNSENVLIAGHGRLLAAKKLGLAAVPVIRLEHLSPAQEKAWRILDNKLARESEWDLGNLELELEFLKESDFDVDGWGLGDFIKTPDFSPASEEDQGKLDELEPKLVQCPSCQCTFDSRGYEQKA